MTENPCEAWVATIVRNGNLWSVFIENIDDKEPVAHFKYWSHATGFARSMGYAIHFPSQLTETVVE